MKTTINKKANAVKPLAGKMEDEVPEQLLKDAKNISNYMKMFDVKRWEIGDICSRNHATERAALLNALKDIHFQLARHMDTGEQAYVDCARTTANDAISQAEGGQS